MLDLLCGADANALGLFVHVELAARDVVQRSLVVLRLEPQVSLHKDENPRPLVANGVPDAPNMVGDELELLAWVWGKN